MFETLPGLYLQVLRCLTGILSLIAAAADLRTIVAGGWAPSLDGFSAAGLLAVCSVLSILVVGSGMFVEVEDEEEEEELGARDARDAYMRWSRNKISETRA